MSHTDLRDFEPETVFDIPGQDNDREPLSIAIAKSGGGTVGRRDGQWRAIVRHGDRELYRGQSLNTPQPCTHGEAAAILADLLAFQLWGTGLDTRLAAWADHYLS